MNTVGTLTDCQISTLLEAHRKAFLSMSYSSCKNTTHSCGINMGNGTSALLMGISTSYIVTCKLGAELLFVVILNIHPLFCLYNPHVWGNLGSKTQRLCSSEVLVCRQGF
jgi:hypothetical protein